MAAVIREKFDALIIGFGKGGKTLAPFLADQGLKVAVVEKSPLMYGGTCINIACIPTKALAHMAHLISREGLDKKSKVKKYAQAIQEKDELVSLLRAKNFDKVNGHPGVTVITGTASFRTSHEVQVETQSGAWVIEADRIFINTGARPVLPDIPGIKSSRVYTSTEMLDLAELPSRLAIIGGGYIGLEFASIYANFGSEVTLIERGPRFMLKEDRDMADEVQKVLEHQGVRIRLATKVNRIQEQEQEQAARLSLTPSAGREEELVADAVLVATGREANTEDLNLEAAGVEVNERGFIQVNDKLQTTASHIWAIGDVNGGPQFTYISLDDFRIIRDQLFGNGLRTTTDRKQVPSSVFIDPPFSHVGLTEAEAIERGFKVKVAKLPAAASPRARQLKQTEGLLKAVIDAETEQLLGFTMFAAESGEVVNIVSLFMKSEQPYTVLRDTIFTHPSMAETLNDLLANI
ncbi:pyridine nucleotide-disulfide oxidoreductase [Paenibacillus faecis]|uniref:FAD-dependent oxidoreductase n=1 Tax=Paenibacillus faecis TaxID=862114 RepID=UPI001B20983C|nr:FAD-dependent oxidoreductase [Paenibacillus faecis]GIO84872.1 pyridine nucleotide-disulfide oxidoreductase [Paenibacillus faecis]